MKHILSIEDEPEWADQIRQVVEGLGHTLTAAADYGEGIHAILACRYDLYVFDNTLHGIRDVSVEFMQMANRGSMRQPVIVYSHDLTRQIHEHVKALDGIFLRKDPDPAKLRDEMQRLLT